jgi:hypothetical protein
VEIFSVAFWFFFAIELFGLTGKWIIFISYKRSEIEDRRLSIAIDIFQKLNLWKNSAIVIFFIEDGYRGYMKNELNFYHKDDCYIWYKFHYKETKNMLLFDRIAKLLFG